MDESRTPASATHAAGRVGLDILETIEHGLYGTPQRPGALAVYDAHLQDAASPALLQVIGYQQVCVARMEGMQVKSAVDGHFDGVIELLIGIRFVVHP